MRGNKLFKFIDKVVGVPLILASFVWTRRRSAGPIQAPSRILIMKFSALGDAILLIPALRALKSAFPGAEVIFLGTSYTLPLLRQFPEYIDEFVTLDLSRILNRPSYIVSLIRQLRTLRCDTVVDFEQWMRLSAFLGSTTGARLRAGFRTDGQQRHVAFTHTVHRDRARHEAENFLALAGLLTGGSGEPALEMKVDEGGLVKAQGFLMRHGWSAGTPIVLLHPGCGEHGFPREWPPEFYGELIQKLADARKMIVVVSGTDGERPVISLLEQEAKRPVARYEIAGLEDFTALVSMATLFISSNNGAMHLAAALKIPQLALHGPTNVRQWGPLNPNAAVIVTSCPQCPCLDLGFEYHRTDGYCMRQIAVPEVLEAARRMLSSGRAL